MGDSEATDSPPPLDTVLTVVSPENIAFQFRLAGPALRAVAFLLDGLLIGSLFIAGGIVVALFGVAAIRAEKRVDLVVTLKAWEKAGEIDRLGLDQGHVDFLGVSIPHMDLPVRPGRDIARVIEVAALHTKLKLSGVNPAEDLQRRLMMQMNPRL